jgi:hypothetical protein
MIIKIQEDLQTQPRQLQRVKKQLLRSNTLEHQKTKKDQN